MNAKNTVSMTGAALALAAAGLFASLSTQVVAEEAQVHCYGINGCKGQNDCKTAETPAKVRLSARAMASRPPPWPSAMLPAVKSANKSVGGGLAQATAAIDRRGVEHATSDNLPRLWPGFTQ